MPLIPQTWLDAQTVNTTTTGVQSQPDIVQLGNGNILVTWTTDDASGAGAPAGTEVFAQIFDPMGGKIGTEFIINHAATTRNEGDADIIALPSGGFIVTYHSVDLDGLGGSNILLEEFDAAGVRVSDAPAVATDTGNATLPNYGNPRGAASSDTSVMIIYDKYVTDPFIGPVASTFGRIYNPTANTYGAEIELHAGFTITKAVITVLADGNYVIAANVDTDDDALVYRVMDATGGSINGGATFVVGTQNNGLSDREASVTALSGGGFVIAWATTNAGDTDINFRVFDAIGSELSAGQVGSTGAANANNEPVVTGLPDGSFVVVYDNDAGNLITAAHISAAGAVLGSFNFDGAATDMSIVTLADGRFAATYQLDGGEVRLEILDTRDGVNATPVYSGAQWQVGTIGNDVFTLDTTTEIAHGHTGNDTITDSGEGSVTIFGDAGNDRISATGSIGTDAFYGGIGTDTIDWTGDTTDTNAVFNLVLGTAVFGAQTDAMQGFEHLTGTAGNDTIMGSTANNTLAGAAGNDTISADSGADVVFGGAGNDLLTGGDGNDILSGGSGIDMLDGGIGNDQLIGGFNADTYIVDHKSDLIIEVAGQGTDRLLARVSYVLAAAADVESLQTISVASTTAINLTGNVLAQNLLGNAGTNQLDGGAGAADTLTGLGGNDSYVIRNAASVIIEGVGQGTADRVLAATSFVLAADDDIEVLQTVSKNSTAALNLTGNALSQSLFGNAGANQLDGREGQDTLTGAGGADRFVFATAIAPTNVDRITDFAHAVDKILLEGGFFTGIGNGGLLDSQFHAGASGQATSSTERIIYETDTGHLWYDADGSNTAIARVLFGTLTNVATGLTASDFIVF